MTAKPRRGHADVTSRHTPHGAARPAYGCPTMTPITIGASLLALVALSGALGLLWRSTTGRIRPSRGTLALAGIDGGSVTLLQLSTAMCSPCVGVHRLLSTIASERDDVRHVNIDLTDRPDLASRLNILQTPTTLILDARGTIHARIGGTPTRSALSAELERVLSHDRNMMAEAQ